ncbi:MAG: molybdopterin molybdotransferase MoeA [Lachnospiraceae bacterium]|nr:molybdopterin molybdotransferase MoeA [Lachnospiraceae bacterium]
MDRIGIELEEAVSLILEHTKQIAETETLSLFEAHGRILAEPVLADHDNPPFPRSPLDGYAFAARFSVGARADAPAVMQVAGCIYAGQYRREPVPAGSAVRIMTGAPIPEGCDCVIRLEDVEVLPSPEAPEDLASGRVKIPMELQPWQNYCFQGEDYRQGTLMAEAHSVIDSATMGILASVGRTSVTVFRKPRVALFVTGDELAEPGRPLPPGKLYGSNLHLLYGRLLELGAKIIKAATVSDDPQAVAAEIQNARAAGADLIVTTGGVSVGDKDIFHQVLPVLGAERLFWRVRMKPGTPAMFALYEGMPMLHLSGNPFAALVTFDLLARPAVEKLGGNANQALRRISAVVDQAFSKASGQRRLIRGFCEQGHVCVPSTDAHASGILASMKGCNCLIDIPAGTPPLAAGDAVEVILL